MDTEPIDTGATWSHPAAPEDGPRQVRVTYLVIGLLCLGASGLWLLGDQDVITGGPDLTLFLPGLLILAGVVGLVAAAVNTHNRRGELR